MGCTQSSSVKTKDQNENPSLINQFMPTAIDSKYILEGDEYKVVKYIAEGGMGVVYSALRRADNKQVALKFFGYNESPVVVEDIHKEIDILTNVSGVYGIVEFYGIFADTKSGYAEYKVDPKAYPVICMELLQGGDMFERIQMRKTVSEMYIATIFKDVILALNGLHQKGYIHRDLKPENLMLVNHEEDSPVKVIDFGMMVKIAPGGVHTSKRTQGTRGFVAPESLNTFEYSAKSDFWQAGCTLYALLSGLPAFSPQRLEQTVAAKYFPMTGVAWENVSDQAKELVALLLQKDPNDRPTADEILSHGWVSGEAPDVDMGEGYYKRIKSLALKHKMKTFFQDHETLLANKLRKAKLRAVLPFLRPGNTSASQSRITLNRRVSADSFRIPSAVETIRLRRRSNSMDIGDISPSNSPMAAKKCVSDSIPHPIVEGHSDSNSFVSDSPEEVESPQQEDDLQEKMNRLSSIMMTSLSGKAFEAATADGSGSEENPTDEEGGVLNSVDVTRAAARGSIDYDTFVAAMLDCELAELACPGVFNIFDIDKTGTVDLKDFLVTMVAFRDAAGEMQHESFSADGEGPQNEGDAFGPEEAESVSRFYFNMFDVNNTGYIDPEELKLAVSCLFADEQQKADDLNSPHMQISVPDIEAMFEAIDTSKTGRIDYGEFKAFYEAVLVNSTTRSDKSSLRIYSNRGVTSDTIKEEPEEEEVPESSR